MQILDQREIVFVHVLVSVVVVIVTNSALLMVELLGSEGAGVVDEVAGGDSGRRLVCTLGVGSVSCLLVRSRE